MRAGVAEVTADPSAAITSALRGGPTARLRWRRPGRAPGPSGWLYDPQPPGPGPSAPRRRSRRTSTPSPPCHLGQQFPGRPAVGADLGRELHQGRPRAERRAEVGGGQHAGAACGGSFRWPSTGRRSEPPGPARAAPDPAPMAAARTTTSAISPPVTPYDSTGAAPSFPRWPFPRPLEGSGRRDREQRPGCPTVIWNPSIDLRGARHRAGYQTLPSSRVGHPGRRPGCGSRRRRSPTAGSWCPTGMPLTFTSIWVPHSPSGCR